MPTVDTSIKVALGDRSYEIVVGRNLLDDLGRRLLALGYSGKVGVVTDKNVGRLFGARVMVGGQDELVFDGNSVIVDRSGSVIARAKGFQEDLLIADLEVGAKGKPVTTRPRKPARQSLPLIDRLVIAPFSPARKRARRAPTEAVPLEPLDQIYQALVLGVRDYVRKNGFESVVIGLSGGIDSALTAVIAVDALGADHVLGLFMDCCKRARRLVKGGGV